jgi:hypothetical protein
MSVVKVIHPRVDPPLVVRHFPSVPSRIFRLVLCVPFPGSSLSHSLRFYYIPIIPHPSLNTAPIGLCLSQFPLHSLPIYLPIVSLKSYSIWHPSNRVSTITRLRTIRYASNPKHPIEIPIHHPTHLQQGSARME